MGVESGKGKERKEQIEGKARKIRKGGGVGWNKKRREGKQWNEEIWTNGTHDTWPKKGWGKGKTIKEKPREGRQEIDCLF